MIYTSSHLTSIVPDPILCFLRPRRLELLLADGAWRIAKRCVIGSMDPLLLRWLLRSSRSSICRRSIRGSCSFTDRAAGIVVVFSRFYPFLYLRNRELGGSQQKINSWLLLTRSSRYQLRLCPRLDASVMRWLVLKCQSKCRAFFSFPWSSGWKRRPHVPHRFGFSSYRVEIRFGLGLDREGGKLIWAITANCLLYILQESLHSDGRWGHLDINFDFRWVG